MNEDVNIAKWYVRKADQSASRGIQFNLGLLAFKNIAKSKKCYYTGLQLDNSTRTIDRVDNSVGYISGNVVACHKSFNQLKSMVECPDNGLTLKNTLSAFLKWSSK